LQDCWLNARRTIEAAATYCSNNPGSNATIFLLRQNADRSRDDVIGSWAVSSSGGAGQSGVFTEHRKLSKAEWQSASPSIWQI